MAGSLQTVQSFDKFALPNPPQILIYADVANAQQCASLQHTTLGREFAIEIRRFSHGYSNKIILACTPSLSDKPEPVV